jgi:hypothetical protein
LIKNAKIKKFYLFFKTNNNDSITIGFQIMFLARIEGVPLSRRTNSTFSRETSDNAVQKLYLEDYKTGRRAKKNVYLC